MGRRSRSARTGAAWPISISTCATSGRRPRARLAPDGRVLAIVTNQDGVSHWTLRDLQAERDLPAPSLPPGVCSFLTFAMDSSQLSFSLTGPQHPLDVWVYDLRSYEARQLTSSS